MYDNVRHWMSGSVREQSCLNVKETALEETRPH